MEKISEGVIKILICTSIVENGRYVRNANTIMVQYVQQFGLTQFTPDPSLLPFPCTSILLLNLSVKDQYKKLFILKMHLAVIVSLYPPKPNPPLHLSSTLFSLIYSYIIMLKWWIFFWELHAFCSIT